VSRFAGLLLGLLMLAPIGVSQADETSEAPTPVAPVKRIAAGTAEALGGGEYRPPGLDVSLIRVSDNDIIKAANAGGEGLAAYFYFSATCPHCLQVAQELSDLAKRLEGKVVFVGIATGSNSLADIREFRDKFGFNFEFYKDYSRSFGSANDASSTPQLYLTRPLPSPATGRETVGELRPYWPGASLTLEMRIRSLLGEDPWQAFESGTYYGPRACGSCHVQEYESWGLTHHSIAYWTLYDRKEAENPECVSCHVTGMGSGGFVSGDHGSSLTDVGCEACHGAGGPHAGTRIPASAARDTCIGCHDADHSVRFSVERGLPHIDHFVSATLSPPEYRAAREAIVKGTAPRPLTAFPEGRNQGGEACASCHAKETKAFKRDPHSQAMKTLAARGSDSDPACVACHSVAKGSVMDHFDGGVGCESCHGPGEQHVAAQGGTENIVGLGESCPVCVVEAICVRCHTPEQDPDWNLEEALKKVGH
jgi:peroxiredoxin